MQAAASSASSPAVIASQTKPFEEELASSSSEESTDEELVASMELGMAQKRPADDVEVRRLRQQRARVDLHFNPNCGAGPLVRHTVTAVVACAANRGPPR